MKQITNGGTSVPVTVVDKDTEQQKVAVGYGDAVKLLKV
jgi:hypothetical protein